MPDIGDTVTESLTVTGGDLTTDVTIVVAKPDGTEVDPAPTPTTDDDGVTWTVDVEYDVTGWWLLTWTITGAGAGVEHQRVFVSPDPEPGGPPAYASLTALKSYLRIQPDDGYGDAEMLDILDEVSREIDSHCSRSFYRSETATARVFRPGYTDFAAVDDFWATTDFAIATGTDGTYGTTWSATDYELEPLNGVVDGVAGWPYTGIRAVGSRRLTVAARATLQVTAKWGWARVPSPVRQSCLILAAATMKLREQPGGPGGFGEWGGIVRARDNPHTTIKLAPYRLDPAVAL